MTSDLLGQMDVVFVVDATGSMAPFMKAAREQARAQAQRVAEEGDLDVRYAVVAYRDHPPQDSTFVTQTNGFGDDEMFQGELSALRPMGGGDTPEAVLDGLIAGANLAFRPQSDRLMFLIGDAPPHEHCACRATPNGVVELLRGRGVRLHAIYITGMEFPVPDESFRELAEGTGGTFESVAVESVAKSAIRMAGAMSEISSMIAASRTYTMTADARRAAGASMSVGEVASSLGWTPDMVRGVSAYMGSRGIESHLEEDEEPRP